MTSPARWRKGEFAKDRVAIVAAAISTIVRQAHDADEAEDAIAALLRDEFYDIAQQTLHEIRLDDE